MIFEFEQREIHYRLKGEGDCLLLLHGFLEDHHIWRRLEDTLSLRYTLVMPDLPGHGQSEVLGEVHSMKRMAVCILALMDHLKIASYDLMGHSMGGYVALAMLEVSPKAVKRLFLLNSTPDPDSDSRRSNRDRGIKILDSDPNKFIGSLIRQLFYPDTANKYEDDILELIRQAETFPLEGIKACMRGMRDRPDRNDVLAAYSGSKYIITASGDPIIQPQRMEEIANLTHSRLILISGGHMSWLENGDEIVKIV